MRQDRRQLVASALAYACGSCGLNSAAGAVHAKILGCMLPPHASQQYLDKSSTPRLYITGDEPMISSSGDAGFDYALAQTLAKISATFSVLPGFAYYEDVDAKNAYATSVARQNNADGTVLFGQRMLKELLKRTQSPDVGVAAVCAHEFGHIVQYKLGLNKIVGVNDSNVRRLELQADFLAGYFAGVRKRERSDFPAEVFAETQHSFGDTLFGDSSHHGTPQERGNAIVEGFKSAFTSRVAFSEAVDRSTKYVNGLQ